MKTLLFLLLASSPVLWAQNVQFQSESTLWKAYMEAKSSDNETEMEQVVDAFIKQMEESDAEIYELPSYLFLEEGYKALNAGDPQTARREFRNAIKMNDYLWPARVGLAKAKKAVDGDAKKAIQLSISGMTNAFSARNTFFLLHLYTWFSQNIYWGLALILFAFAFVMFIKYLRPFYISILTTFEDYNPLYSKLIAIFSLLFPLALGMNIYLTALLYLVLLYPFFESRERLAAIFILLCSILLPLLNGFISNLNHTITDPNLRAHLPHFFNAQIDERIAYLTENPGVGDEEALSYLILGKLHKIQGNYEAALEQYGKVPNSSKHWATAQVNIGNIRFWSKEYDEATEAYNAAKAKDPDMALAYFNLGVVQAKQGDHEMAERYRQMGVDRNPRLENLITSEVRDVKPNTAGIMSKRLLSFNLNGEPIYMAPTMLIPIGLIFLCLLLAIIHSKVKNPLMISKSCTKCGRVHFPNETTNESWCSQCVNLYLTKEDLPSEAKNRKYEEVKIFNRKRRAIITVMQIFLPGSKRLLKDASLGGLMTIAVWVMMLVFCVSPVSMIGDPSMSYITWPTITSIITIFITVIFWLIFGLRPIWQEN